MDRRRLGTFREEDHHLEEICEETLDVDKTSDGECRRVIWDLDPDEECRWTVEWEDPTEEDSEEECRRLWAVAEAVVETSTVDAMVDEWHPQEEVVDVV